MLSYRISPALYGNRSAEADAVTSAEIRFAPEQQRDGMIVVPSAARRPDGRPRFELVLPGIAVEDVGGMLLLAYEQSFYGYEAPCRLFLEAHLAPGDVFIDIGAHWGLYALDVATGPVPEVAVLACEPVPLNVQFLRQLLRSNGAESRVEVIQCAVADVEGEAAMTPGNTMRWRLSTTGPGRHAGDPGRYTVRVATVDGILRERPALTGRRIILKIDVEGAEWAVLQGARAALDSGRVAAILFEYQPGYTQAAQQHELLAMLQQRGFRLARFPHHHMGGALLDFAPDETYCNVIAISADLQPGAAYATRYRGYAPLPPPYYHEQDVVQRARRAAILREWRATDAMRWSDPRNLPPGGAERARVAAARVRPGERILDLGAGSGELKNALPAGCSYLPVDLIPRDDDTLLLDLNHPLPDGLPVHHAVASRILEHLHDPAAMLRSCARQAARLTCIHAVGGEPAGPDRMSTMADVVALIESAGWRVLESASHGDEIVCHCARTWST